MENKKAGIGRVIVGIILALAGIGIKVANISLVTVEGAPELSATLTLVGTIALIVIGVVLCVTYFISNKK